MEKAFIEKKREGRQELMMHALHSVSVSLSRRALSCDSLTQPLWFLNLVFKRKKHLIFTYNCFYSNYLCLKNPVLFSLHGMACPCREEKSRKSGKRRTNNEERKVAKRDRDRHQSPRETPHGHPLGLPLFFLSAEFGHVSKHPICADQLRGLH